MLGQARGAAADLRGKADEHARRVVREAQESARELRTSTQQAVEAKTREAEEAARRPGGRSWARPAHCATAFSPT